ncbi:DUF4167 domain-containing protein [Oricola sp.]|uniref:DUF4167 domain-containing protein n=1 Tax=Oricola sp. TaxID=1979950 RepID=UPI0025CFABB8|nr:DUF4167 domain-containing protein [Oricola sp.]MCI5075270.1 DUF4167 domain-containing protein [Oricola sp.]
MRPQQQGRRQRNRGNGGGGRRNQNPLSRNYESNGPDVKIRGNAQVIADKYTTLARDALSSGDSVMAENYLQHAEHYNRIIMAAQAQAQAQRDERAQGGDQDDDGDDSMSSADNENARQDNPRQENARQENARQDKEPRKRDREPQAAKTNGEAQPNGQDAAEAPQPVIGETPVEVALEEQEQERAAAPAKRAPRRPRKPRRTAEESEAASEMSEDAASGDAEAVAAEA